MSLFVRSAAAGPRFLPVPPGVLVCLIEFYGTVQVNVRVAQSLVIVLRSADVSISSLDSQETDGITAPGAVSHVVAVAFADDSDDAPATCLVPVGSFAPVHDVDWVRIDATNTVLAVGVGAVAVAIVAVVGREGGG